MDRIEKLKEFLSEQPGDPFLQHALAMEWMGMGEERQARELFQKNITANPDYVGSYYQLGQLLERAGEEATAIKIYQKGMQAAEKAADTRSLNELRSALEELSF